MINLELTKEEFELVRLGTAKILADPTFPNGVNTKALKGLIAKFTAELTKMYADLQKQTVQETSP